MHSTQDLKNLCPVQWNTGEVPNIHFCLPLPPRKISPPHRQYSFNREHWAHTLAVFAELLPRSSTESRYFPVRLMRLCYWKFWLPDWLLDLLYCVHKEARITVSQMFPIISGQCISTWFISWVFLCISLYAVQDFCWRRGTVAQKRLSSLPQKDLAVPKSDLQPEYQLAGPVYTGSPLLQPSSNTGNIPLCVFKQQELCSLVQ